MKTHRFFVLSLVCTLVLSACAGNKAGATATPPLSAADIYTAVASTLTAQPGPATEIPTTILPTDNNPTLMSTNTLAALPTNYSSYSYQTMTPGTSSSNTGGCDNSVYVSDVSIPDGTVLAPGQSFTKTWMLQNTGTCTWSTSYYLNFVSGSQMSGSSTNLTSSVASSQEIEISVSMVAPSSTGSYTGDWKMVNASGVEFGSTVWVQVVVSSSASTLTPTLTPTITSTPTITLTPTITQTPTITRTSSPTKTPTPTKTKASTSTPIPTETSIPTRTTAPTSVSSDTNTPVPAPTNGG